MKRPDISGLKGNYLMRFQIGIIVALATTIAAFNFTTYPAKPNDVNIVIMEPYDEVQIIRTPANKKKELPPPN